MIQFDRSNNRNITFNASIKCRKLINKNLKFIKKKRANFNGHNIIFNLI